jgi:transcriptional regulator with XRE-family HTH domain
MSIREVRRDNLLQLLKGYETQEEFAEKSGLAAPHVSQMVNNKRAMGEVVARRIEEKQRLPDGWMDQDHREEAGISQEALRIAKEIAELTPQKLLIIKEMLSSWR